MLSRVLAALGVGVWCLLLLLAAVGFIIDRGLADVGIVWIAFLAIGVVAPVLRTKTLAAPYQAQGRRNSSASSMSGV
jgi:hypothetical protein